MKNFVRAAFLFLGVCVLWAGLALADPSTGVPVKKPTPTTTIQVPVK